MTFTYKDRKVIFASLTKPEGHKDGKHMLGIEVSKAEKKELVKKFAEVWEDGKSKKDKKPKYDVKDWFSKNDDGVLVFWLKRKADSKPMTFKIADKKMEADMFTTLGEGSIVDVEFDFYFHDYNGDVMVLRSLNAIRLVKYIEYTGSEGGSTLDGETVEVDSKKKKKNKDAPAVTGDDKVVKKFEKAIDKGNKEKAEGLLADLKDHADFKKFKKAVKKLGK